MKSRSDLRRRDCDEEAFDMENEVETSSLADICDIAGEAGRPSLSPAEEILVNGGGRVPELASGGEDMSLRFVGGEWRRKMTSNSGRCGVSRVSSGHKES